MRIAVILIVVLAITVPVVGLKFGLLDHILGQGDSNRVVRVEAMSDQDVATDNKSNFPVEMTSFQAEDQELWDYLWERILKAYPEGYDYSVVDFKYRDVTCDGTKEYIASHIYHSSEGSFFVIRIATRLIDGSIRHGRSMLPFQATVDQVHGLCLALESEPAASLALNDFAEDSDLMNTVGDMICPKGFILDDQVCSPHFLFWPRSIPEEGDVSLVMYRGE